MKAGVIKWFDSLKGFGVIGTPGGKEVFLHSSNLSIGLRELAPSDVLLFEVAFEKGKDTAKNVHTPKSYNDFKAIMELLGGERLVYNQEKVTLKSKWGKPYTSTVTKSFDVLTNGIKEFCLQNDFEVIFESINKYYSQEIVEKKPELFISYCQLLEPLIVATKGTDYSIARNYLYFGQQKNSLILFEVWKGKEFRLIGYEDYKKEEDYEIPKEVLWENKEKLNYELLIRTYQYSFGEQFCIKYFDWLIENENGKPLCVILSTSPFKLIKILEETDEYLSLKATVSKLIKDAFSEELAIRCFQIIGSSNYEDFNNLFSTVPKNLPPELEVELNELVRKKIIEVCDEDILYQFWYNGKIDVYDFNKVKSDFENTDLTKHVKVFKLLKSESERIELIRTLATSNRWDYLFAILTDYLKSCNQLGYSFSLKDKMNDYDFWQEQTGGVLIQEVNSEIENITDQSHKIDLFQKGYSKDYSKEFVFATLEKYPVFAIAKFLSASDLEYSLKLLLKRIELFPEIIDLRETMSLGVQVLPNKSFENLDEYCFKNTDESAYFQLWLEGIGKIFPESHITLLLNQDETQYEDIVKWLSKGLVKSHIIEELLFRKLQSIGKVQDRGSFYTVVNLIRKLTSLNIEWVEKVFNEGNDFFQIILWFLELKKELNFDVLKQKFIYFKPESQVLILKKLFSLKAKGFFDLDIEKLQEIRRVSLDIHRLNERLNPDIPLDLSTDLVIESLTSYSKNNKFLVETELISVVLQNLYGNNKRRFKIDSYFERCPGRLEGDFNWKNQSGTISKEPFGEGRFYFKIVFEYDAHLVEEVKKLPGRIWNQEERNWSVPTRSEIEVLEFARQNRFFLDFEGSNYENNVHFAEFSRKDIPNGITFCEGRIANIEHRTFKQKFWWCANQPCFQNCETIHQATDWHNYSLLDFCKILGLNLDEQSQSGFIPNGYYLQFISKINRFNRLLERMYCRSCEQILYPDESSNYAAYTVVKFSCQNTNCIEYHKSVYLNHCLNGKCNSIIDSRDSERCHYHNHLYFTGLYICNDCGSCCSHAMMTRRLENLQLTGGLINPELKIKVAEKLGHLERAEYFCFKCSKDMVEYSPTLFKCVDCKVEYDLEKYKIAHPHKHLRRNDYPTLMREEGY